MQARLRRVLTAATLGAVVAWLALNAFGYLVAFHHFGRAAERTVWLVPLLHILSWLPFIAIGTIFTFRLVPVHPIISGFVAGLIAAGTVIALYYTPTEPLSYIISISWLHLLCPLALFPVFYWLLALKKHQITD